MDRFRNILAVYSDDPGGDDVLVQAVGLARASGAALTVVNPWAPPRPTKMVDEARRRLLRIVPWIEQEGVTDVTTRVIVGTPHIEIIRNVLEDEHDLVIVGAECGHGIRDVIFGNTAINLMLQCPCAVWVLKPGQSTPCANVVAALNLCGDQPDGDDVDDRILDLAASLARAHDARLHLVHFWQAEGRDDEMLRSEIRRKTMRQILRRNESTRREAVNALLNSCPMAPTEPEIHLPRGSPHARLVELVDRLSADLVVMGTACRRGVSRLLTGNLSEAVLSGARCGVLAVKPNEFRTPVFPAHHDAPPHHTYATVR
jgi:nucleotide-binding universal stress UspA family protein